MVKNGNHPHEGSRDDLSTTWDSHWIRRTTHGEKLNPGSKLGGGLHGIA